MRLTKLLLMVFGLFAVGGLNGYAQDKVPGIIVELTTGEKIEYRLMDIPKLMFNGQTITLTADGVRVEYLPSELAKVTTGEVKDVSSDIEELIPQTGNVSVESGFVRLSGFKDGECVRIYSVGGTLTASYKTINGSLVIPILMLPSGVSIIKINQQTIKISK